MPPGGVLMSVFGVTTGHYDNLPVLVLACNLSLLLPLTVLARIPKSLGDWSPSQPVPASMSMSSSSSSLESMENPLLASSASGNSPLNSSKFAVPGEPAAGQVASGDDLIAMPSLVPAALTAFTISPRTVTVRQVAALTMRATLTAECSTDSTNSTWSDDEEAGPSGVSYRDPIAFRAVGKGQLDRLVSSRRSRVASKDGYLDNAASIRPWGGWDGWSGSDIDNGSSMDSSTVSTSSDPQQPHAASSLDASMPQPVVQGPSADSQRPGEGRQHGGEEYGVLIGSDQHGMYAAVGELERKRRKRASKRKARTPPTGSNATDQQKQ